MNSVRVIALVFIPLVLFSAYFAWAQNRDANQAASVALGPEFVDVTDPNELLPDLIPLPARDLKFEKTEDGRTLLYFSTTYYNQGRGPVELRIDDEQTDVEADVDRQVMQRIYLKTGGHRDSEVGEFAWHQEHLHYHFNAFVEYNLEAVDAISHEDLSGSRIKSTFCLRDVSRVELALPNREGEARYVQCGKSLQGVSVGWGDTYYWDYPAQHMEISSLSSGTYRFMQRVNPESRLEEINYENNASSVLFRLNMEKGTVEVLEEIPSTTPPVEHVHLEDPFGI